MKKFLKAVSLIGIGMMMMMMTTGAVALAQGGSARPSEGVRDGGGDQRPTELVCRTRGSGPVATVSQALLGDTQPEITLTIGGVSRTAAALSRLGLFEVLAAVRASFGDQAPVSSLAIDMHAYDNLESVALTRQTLSLTVYLDLKSKDAGSNVVHFAGLLSAEAKGQRVERAVIDCAYSPTAIHDHLPLAP